MLVRIVLLLALSQGAVTHKLLTYLDCVGPTFGRCTRQSKHSPLGPLSSQKAHFTPTSVDQQHEAVKTFHWDLSSAKKTHFTPPSVDQNHEAVKALHWDLSSATKKRTSLHRLLTKTTRQSKHSTGTSLQPQKRTSLQRLLTNSTRQSLHCDLSSAKKMHFTPTSVDQNLEAVKALHWDLSSAKKNRTSLQRLLIKTSRQSKHSTGTYLSPARMCVSLQRLLRNWKS